MRPAVSVTVTDAVNDPVIDVVSDPVSGPSVPLTSAPEPESASGGSAIPETRMVAVPLRSDAPVAVTTSTAERGVSVQFVPLT
mgnify:CR=1 FL=1